MHQSLQKLTDGIIFTGNIPEDALTFFNHHGFPKTAEHSQAVAEKSRELAIRFDANPEQAEIGGWLHDISVIFPNAERIKVAHELDVEVLPEEDIFPMIIHQKLSAVIARDIFSVDDEAILSAIGCHTTLKRDASLLDKIVFVADKIAWDQVGNPPYIDNLLPALDKSIDHAAFVYLDYLWQMRDSLKVLHPWGADAHQQLKQSLGDFP